MPARRLHQAGKTWKGYFQNLPPVPSTGIIMTGPDANGPYSFKWPSDTDALYASKHNPFVNFTGTQTALANMVPDTQLGADLAAGDLPNYSLVVPDQCHECMAIRRLSPVLPATARSHRPGAGGSVSAATG